MHYFASYFGHRAQLEQNGMSQKLEKKDLLMHRKHVYILRHIGGRKNAMF